MAEWVRTTIYSESKKIEDWLKNGRSVDDYIKTMGLSESFLEQIYNKSR
jgi:hypothetical protein